MTILNPTLNLSQRPTMAAPTLAQRPWRPTVVLSRSRGAILRSSRWNGMPCNHFSTSASRSIMEMTGFSDTQLMVREAISQVCSQFPNTVHTGPIRALPIRVVDRCDTNRSETYSLRFAFIAAQENARDKGDRPHSNTAGSWFRGWTWNWVEGQRASQIQHAHPRRGRDPGFA